MTYGVAEWPVAGRGCHRALVAVTEKTEAVWAHIEWRRPDPHPERKAVRVLAAGAKEPLRNVVAASLTPAYGDIIFEPANGPGVYEIYFLPFDPPTGPMPGSWWPGAYYKPEETADPQWRARHGIAGAEQLAAGRWRALPQAAVMALQARTEFDRFDPMEIIATPEEVEGWLQQHKLAGVPYLLFPEDREHPIRMFDYLPRRWLAREPQAELEGQAQPDEFYAFQIGVYARRPIRQLRVRFSDFRSAEGRKIPAAAFRCFNLEGVDWLGRPWRGNFSVGAGKIRPLWLGVHLPKQAQGLYRGTIEIAPVDMPSKLINLSLRVAGPALAEHGYREAWRQARLEWLDSRRGLEDKVVPPYTPLIVKGAKIGLLNREILVGRGGLPEQLLSNGHELLAAPMAWILETAEGALSFPRARSRWTTRNEARAVRITEADGPAGRLRVETQTEFDGCINVRVAFTPRVALTLRDARLELPLRREIATYMMGMGKQGGYRPQEWRWQWGKLADNMVWLGDVEAGVQLKLCPEKEAWQIGRLTATGPAAAWHNAGRGGCEIKELGDRVLVRAYSGERALPAGQPIEWRFRLLLTPFKPLDRRHWTWRIGGWGALADSANIRHLHHGEHENPYINYPFLTWERQRALVERFAQGEAEGVPVRHPLGSVYYPAAGHFPLRRGALHLWVRVDFDPQVAIPPEMEPKRAIFNQGLFECQWPNGDGFGFYWNIDDRGMRTYLRRGAPPHERYPLVLGSHSPEWHQGERHLVSLSWDEKIVIFVDGKPLAEAPYPRDWRSASEEGQIVLTGGFAVEAIKISAVPDMGEALPTPQADEQTLLLDTFVRAAEGDRWLPDKAAAGAYAHVQGFVRREPGPFGLRLVFLPEKATKPQPQALCIYYTVRELSNRCSELWALRSFGNEILETGGVDIYNDPEAREKTPESGHPWLKEHLIAGYIPAWMHPLSDAEADAAVAVTGLSRWHNFYVEGLYWLMKWTGVRGLYLDGIGYDREIMKRVARVMHAADPQSFIIFHSGNHWAPPWDPEHKTSPANDYMEHFPYISRLWFGELYDYENTPPDYWLVEMSGIPFGLTNEMLQYENGGNPYRGMIYGMTGRFHPSTSYLWRLFDQFQIQEAEMLGYWSSRCPVRTDNPGVLATVYRKPHEALIAIADWTGAREPFSVRLQIDWQALGLDKGRARLFAPAIPYFQPMAEFALTEPIPIKPRQGWLLWLRED